MSTERFDEEIPVGDIVFDMKIRFPEAARRVEVLEGLKRYWAQIIGFQYARYSQPYKLGTDMLCIHVTNEFTEKQLRKSKGNIVRAMKDKFKYNAGENFRLMLMRTIPKEKQPAKKTDTPAHDVNISEETIRQYMQEAPDTLPEDINYAISHLQAFIAERFPTPQSRT